MRIWGSYLGPWPGTPRFGVFDFFPTLQFCGFDVGGGYVSIGWGFWSAYFEWEARSPGKLDDGN